MIGHECTFTKHAHVKFQVKSTIWVEYDGSLRVLNGYEITATSGITLKILSTSKNSEYEDARRWLGTLFGEAGSPFVGWNADSDIVVPRPRVTSGI